MASKIFIIGARGAGKTTLGRMLAAELGLPFVDTDELLARRWHAGRSESEAVSAAELSAEEAVNLIPAIIEREGWDIFRQIEGAALREAALHYTIIATGGGIVLDPANRDLMRRSGVVVYLRAPAAVLAGRVKRDSGNNRPSLTGLDPAEEMAEVLRRREPLYLELADHELDAGAPAHLAAEALKRIFLLKK